MECFSSNFTDMASLSRPLCFWVFLTHSWTSDCISDNLKAVHFHSCSDICPPGPHTKYLPSFRLLGSKPLPDQIINICNIISSVRMDLGREMSTGIYLCLGISLLQASVFFFSLPLLTYNSQLASLCAILVYHRVKAHITSLPSFWGHQEGGTWKKIPNACKFLGPEQIYEECAEIRKVSPINVHSFIPVPTMRPCISNIYLI